MSPSVIIRLVPACAGLLVMAGACSSASGPKDEAQSIVVTVSGQHQVGLNLRGGITLTVVAKDATGATIAVPGPLKFTSRDPSIATVDTTGLVFGRAVGDTFVVATLQTSTRILADSVDVDVATLLSARVRIGERAAGAKN